MTTSLHLHKENFKFSAAHFLIFDKDRAERLHGHNYQVRVDLQMVPKHSSFALGYTLDFHWVKKVIKGLVDSWDERVLLPAKNSEVKTAREGRSLRVVFRDRLYVFPHEEVLLLPIQNTSVEELSGLFAQLLSRELVGKGVSGLRVLITETRGQGAAATLRL